MGLARAVGQQGRVETFGFQKHGGVHIHQAEQVLELLDVTGVYPSGKEVELAVGFALFGEVRHKIPQRYVVAADHAAHEARRVYSDEVHFTVCIFFLEQTVVKLGHHAIDVVADDFCGTGGDDGDDLHVRIAHEQHVHGFFHPVGGPEDRAVFMHGGGRHFEVVLEVLGKQQAHEHDAALTAVDNADAVLDADADILRAAGLTGENGVDDPRPFFFHYFARHGSPLLLGLVLSTWGLSVPGSVNRE